MEFWFGIVAGWTPGAASRGRAGTGRDHTAAAGVADPAPPERTCGVRSGDSRSSPGGALPDKNELCKVSSVSPQVEEAALERLT